MSNMMLSLFKKKKGGDTPLSLADQLDDRKKDVGGLFSFKRHGKNNGLGEKISRSEGKTEQFRYALNVAPHIPDPDEGLKRIENQNLKISTKREVIDDIPELDLTEWKMTVPLHLMLPKGWEKRYKKWIILEEIVCIYTSSSAITDAGGSVTVRILDIGKRFDQMVKEVKGQSQVSFGVIGGAPYGIPKKEMFRLQFEVECANNTIIEGLTWGSICLSITLMTADRNIVVNNPAVIGSLLLPQTFLSKEKENPDSIDLTIDETHVTAIRDMAKSGRIRDPSKPPTQQKKIMYTGSAVGSDDDRSLGDFDDDDVVLPPVTAKGKGVARRAPKPSLNPTSLNQLGKSEGHAKKRLTNYVSSTAEDMLPLESPQIEWSDRDDDKVSDIRSSDNGSVAGEVEQKTSEKANTTRDSVDVRIGEAQNNVFASGAKIIDERNDKATKKDAAAKRKSAMKKANVDAAPTLSDVEYPKHKPNKYGNTVAIKEGSHPVSSNPPAAFIEEEKADVVDKVQSFSGAPEYVEGMY